MSSARADDPHVPIDIRGAAVSTVVVQRVPPDCAERFLECQRGLTQAVEGFAGYKATELYPPASDRQEEWVAVIHFNDHESLQRWIDSPERALWVKKLRDEIGDFQLKTLPAGFGAWFAGLATGPDGEPPPSWKIAMTVLLGLYPTVMVLFVLVGPYLNSLGIAVSMLISNVFSVALTQWVVIPPLMNVLGPWLRANAPDKRAISIGVFLLIWLLLGVLTLVFRMMTG
jgi:hypothetical protein